MTSKWKLDTTLKPWELYAQENFSPSEKQIIESWATFQPKDFYFAYAEQFPDSCLIYLVPIEYFKLYNTTFSDSMAIIHLLPNTFDEVFQGMYEVDRSKSITMIDLLNRGFVWTKEFQRFIDEEVNGPTDLQLEIMDNPQRYKQSG